MKPSSNLPAPDNHALVLIDFEGQMGFATKSIALSELRTNTAIQYLLKLQRDWARQETYGPVTDLMKKYGGAYGIGIHYAHNMLQHH